MKIKFDTNKNRIFGLDIVRAIAIILVVLAHGRFLLKDTAIEGFPYFRMIDGVDLFFVLSGFLIGGILLREINEAKCFNLGQLINFWKRRWFRTLPNYYLILLVNYIVVRYGIINESIEQFNIHFIFFTQNLITPFFGFFWESWSLSIEEWFYIVTPLLIFFILKVLPVKQSFLISTLIMILIPIIYRYCIFNAGIDDFTWDITFRKTVLCRIDSIGYGLFSAWFYYYYSRIWKNRKMPFFVCGMLLLLFLVNFDQNSNTYYKQIIYFSLSPISVMFMLPLAESYRKSSGLIVYSIQHISKISYSMYLINLALVAEVIRDNFAPQGGIDGVVKYLIYWIIVIIVSTILYKYFEKPIMNLRDINFKQLTKQKRN